MSDRVITVAADVPSPGEPAGAIVGTVRTERRLPSLIQRHESPRPQTRAGGSGAHG
jgi:hypothetical protein